MSCCVARHRPLILGIIALTKNSTTPRVRAGSPSSGWIGFGIGMALVVIGVVIFIAVGASGGFDGGGSYDSDYSY